VWNVSSVYHTGKYPTKKAAEEAFECAVIAGGIRDSMQEFVTPGWKEPEDDADIEELYTLEEEGEEGGGGAAEGSSSAGASASGGAGCAAAAAARCPPRCHVGTKKCPRLASHREFLANFEGLVARAAREFADASLPARLMKACER
jgi:hypothetical protein